MLSAWILTLPITFIVPVMPINMTLLAPEVTTCAVLASALLAAIAMGLGWMLTIPAPAALDFICHHAIRALFENLGLPR